MKKIQLKKLVSLRESGNYLKCIDVITKFIKESNRISPGLKRSLIGLRSDCYLDAEKWKEALFDLETLLEEKPAPALFGNRGFALWEIGDLDSAFQDLRRAIKGDPSAPIPCRNMAILQVQRNNILSGLWYIRRAIKIAPNDACGFVILGDIFAKLDKWVQAYPAYITALRLDPSNKRAAQQIDKIEKFAATL
jgi:tetratricopeptide (TPR) repeat protein